MGGEVEAYQEVARRLGLLPEGNEAGAVLDMEKHRRKREKLAWRAFSLSS
jgi:phosphoribosylaminoimidazole-succinocarboxamide synthase